MSTKTALVVTSISSPNQAMRALAIGAARNNFDFLVIGDSKSPSSYQLDGAQFFSLEEQLARGGRFANLCPTKHYARKNVGYLMAIESGAELIIETDDDNLPYESFWAARKRVQTAAVLENTGWTNIYSYFTQANIWPRGLPLDAVQSRQPEYDSLPTREADCPIQQGLADEDPDVDAIYRLTLPLPLTFESGRRLALGWNAWCPFNSQNTTWWKDAFPLLYLPAYCSLRMTDIWRSFVAQRIASVNRWAVLFHEATVWQERNEHNLMRDFEDEIPGYLNNRKIGNTLESLDLRPGINKLSENLLLCYEALVRIGVIDARELALAEAWTSSIAASEQQRRSAAS
jgi:hypothetical protein